MRLPDMPMWFYLPMMFACGVMILVVTLLMPERSAGPIGYVYAAVFIGGPLWALWAILRSRSSDGNIPKDGSQA